MSNIYNRSNYTALKVSRDWSGTSNWHSSVVSSLFNFNSSLLFSELLTGLTLFIRTKQWCSAPSAAVGLRHRCRQCRLVLGSPVLGCRYEGELGFSDTWDDGSKRTETTWSRKKRTRRVFTCRWFSRDKDPRVQRKIRIADDWVENISLNC